MKLILLIVLLFLSSIVSASNIALSPVNVSMNVSTQDLEDKTIRDIAMIVLAIIIIIIIFLSFLHKDLNKHLGKQ